MRDWEQGIVHLNVTVPKINKMMINERNRGEIVKARIEGEEELNEADEEEDEDVYQLIWDDPCRGIEKGTE